MKKDICLLLLTVVFLLTGCNQVQTTEGYVNSKLNEYSKSAVRFIRLTESENELNLKSCHPVEYFRTLTPPDSYGDCRECVGIRYQEGIIYAVEGTGAIYFFDNHMLTRNRGLISAMQTPANYWLPAVCSNDGQAVGYECIAQGVNRTYAITSYDRLMTKLVNMGISEEVNIYKLPAITFK